MNRLIIAAALLLTSPAMAQSPSTPYTPREQVLNTLLMNEQQQHRDHAIALNEQKAKLQDEVTLLHNQIDAKDKQIADLTKVGSDKDTEIEAKDKQISDLTKAGSDKDTEIKTLTDDAKKHSDAPASSADH